MRVTSYGRRFVPQSTIDRRVQAKDDRCARALRARMAVLTPEVVPYASVVVIRDEPVTTKLHLTAREFTACTELRAQGRSLVDALRAIQSMRAFLASFPLVVLALLLAAVPASAQDRPRLGPAPYLVMVLGSTVDLSTTLVALHTGAGQEGNPFLAHTGTPGLVGGKVAATAGLAYLMRHLAKHGHPRVATVLGYTAGIALAGVGARNAQVGR